MLIGTPRTLRAPLPYPGCHRVQDVLDAGGELPALDVGPDDVFTLLYTSGTTSFPKGAMISHRNCVPHGWHTGEVLREAGIRVTQFTVLVAAHLSGEAPVSQMAQILVMDRTTLTRNLKPLEAQGLITIRAGADRRSVLTPQETSPRRLAVTRPPTQRRRSTGRSACRPGIDCADGNRSSCGDALCR